MSSRDIIESHLENIQKKYRLAGEVELIINQSETKESGEKKFPLIVLRKNEDSILLESHEAFVFESITAGIDIKELNSLYFQTFSKLGTDYIDKLIKHWLTIGLIEPVEKDIYNLIEKRTKKTDQRLTGFVRKLFRVLIFKLDFGSADKFYSFLYKILRKFIFNRQIFLSVAAIAISGLFLCSTNCKITFINPGDTLLNNFLTVLIINMISIFIHESAHALTAKKYNLPIRSVGVLFFLGYPVFYADTTNAWSLPKKQRIAISSAGIVSNLFVGGICAMISVFVRDISLQYLLFQMLTVNFFSFAINLIPFVEFDGYYILIDLLDEPKLKSRSIKTLLNFLRGERVGNNKNRLIFLLGFGLMSIVSIGALLFLTITLWLNFISKFF
ncbi:M50 family metallopeptidase [Candidatus Dojkabacteria bacterium]|nr:M50 family metallopeptidase [Candidatus Dojkabacteria bacterium]